MDGDGLLLVGACGEAGIVCEKGSYEGAAEGGIPVWLEEGGILREVGDVLPGSADES